MILLLDEISESLAVVFLRQRRIINSAMQYSITCDD